MLPLPSSATSAASQKPAAVAGPPSPSSVPPPATVTICPGATTAPPAGFAGPLADRDSVPCAGSDRGVRFELSPQAAAAPDSAVTSTAYDAPRRTNRGRPGAKLIIEGAFLRRG